MRRLLCVFVAVVCVGFGLGPAASGQVVISEFMAGNTRSLADEDGEFPDWIELHNTGNSAVNLLDWALTDDAARLTKWRLPATNLPPDGFLVVFASGKDRRRGAGPWHTNFRLSSSGEYLALVRPDGTNVAAAFAPVFPPQADDVSFGLDTGLRQVELLGTNAAAKFLVPITGAEGSDWIQPGFNDSGWRSVTGGVGFETSWFRQPSLTALTNGLAGYWPFDETSGISAADASGRGNNGRLNNFPANGSQWIAGKVGGGLRFRGAPGNDYVRVTNYAKATTALTVAAWVWADSRPTWATIAKNWGTAGGNFHFGLRETAGDLDIFLNTSGGQINVRENRPFPTGEWQHVAFVADGATLRLFRNGVLVGSGNYTGNFVNSPVAALGIGVKLNDAGTGADTGAPGYWQGRIDDLAIWNRALSVEELASVRVTGGSFRPFIGTDVREGFQGIGASCYLRFPFVVTDPTALTRWLLRVRYDDGFAAWLNGVELTRDNAPEFIDWSSTATADRSVAEAITAENFQLDGLTSGFVAGTNLLAIQALNLSPTDADFLFQATLEAASSTATTNALVYFTTPTPGRENRVGTAVLGPIIRDVVHTPSVPRDNEDLVVTARISPAFGAVASVTLQYRIMYGATNTTPMLDDGLQGDGAAGDGVYGASIPSNLSTNGEMIRYIVRATDAAGRASRLPLFNDPLDSDEYFGTVVANPAITTPLPVFHWFVQIPARAEADPGTRCSLFYNGEFYDNVYVRIRGGTSRGWPKKSYKVEFNENHEFEYEPGARRITEFDFNTTYTDKSYVRSVLVYEHQRDAGLPTPITFLTHLRQNSQFYSVTIFSEQPDKDFLIRNGLDVNGAFYKCGPGSTYDVGTVGAFEKKTRRFESNADAVALLTNLSLRGTDLETFVFDQLDVPAMVNFMAIVATTQNIDASDKNHFLYRDTEGSGEWRMLPWDQDLSFGPDALNTDNMYYNLQNVLAPACASHPFIGVRPYLLHSGKWNRLLEAIVNTPRTRLMLLRRIRTLTEEYLMTGYFQRRIDQLVAQLDADVLLDKARWRGNAAFPGATYTLQAATDRIKNLYLAPRVGYLTGTNIAGVGITNPSAQPLNVTVRIAGVEANPASRNQAEEYLCLTNPTPLAIDLSGWRMSGAVQHEFKPGTVLPAGGVMYLSPDVRAFRRRASGPRGGQGLFVQGNYRGKLSARGEVVEIFDPLGRRVDRLTYPGAPSATQESLRITEIMYHPDARPGDAFDAEEYEFFEVRNVSATAALDLRGVRLVNGVAFDFSTGAVTTLAPRQAVAVVKNRAAFNARYGGALAVAGQYEGTLENNGERIQLVDASGEEILDFSYNNSWFPITDGAGFSLVVVNESAEPELWNSRVNWRASGRLGGSPAVEDPAPPTFAPVVINEVRANSVEHLDFIELHNPSAAPANVGGWFLSDQFSVPKKFRIPNDTVIAPGGYVVFAEDTSFGSVLHALAPFGLDGEGDQVWLFSGDAATNLTGYVHGFDLAVSEEGVNFGRHVTSIGEEHLVAQRANTLGATNAGPRIGPIVISEIMFRPPDLAGGNDNSAEEFIELFNASTNHVPLHDTASPPNTWRLRGGADFDFPPNVTMAASEVLLLVNFDPATNATALAAFRSRNSVPAGVRMFGPYRGKLDNSRDVLELRKPIAAPAPLTTAYPVADRVEYRDSAPWPAGADGFGLSLHRVDAQAYGDDPASWRAVSPSAGVFQSVGGDTAPRIVTGPADQAIVAYQNAVFSVSATGTAPLQYQWRHNGALLPSATNALLALANVQPRQGGAYDVLVYNRSGSIVSTSATLTVSLPASILTQPQPAATRPGGNATFNITAYSPAPLRYQWRRDGINLAGATNATLTLVNVDVPDRGRYDVIVTDDIGPVASTPATLTVLINPVIVQNPLSTAVAPGANVTFSIVVTNTATLPINYRWRRNGVTISSNSLNEATAYFTATNIQADGTYTVIVANSSLTTGNLSAPATVTVITDTDRDGLPDAWEQANGLNANDDQDARLDSDGDTMSNAAEYLAGTDPRDAASYLKVSRLTPGASATIEFLAISNRTYSVLFADSPATNVWSRLADVSAGATNHVETVVDPGAASVRFYRLATPRQADR